MIVPGNSDSPGRWDAGYWDVSRWDDAQLNSQYIVFNLDGAQNNGEGSSLQLEFVQEDADAPVTILGWSVVWDDMSTRT